MRSLQMPTTLHEPVTLEDFLKLPETVPASELIKPNFSVSNYNVLP